MIRSRAVSPPSSRSALCAAVTLAALSLVTGCSTPIPPDDVAYMQPGGSLDAEITGVLRREGGCVYLDGEEGSAPMVAVFQDRGIRWDGDTLRVGSKLYPMGERMQFGGGGSQEPPYGAMIPEGCDADAYWQIAP
jgi:hypothetical protein